MEVLGDIIYREKFGIENGSHIRDGILMVLEGRFSFEILGKAGIAEQGDICVFPANAAFRRYVLQPIRCVYLQFNVFPVPLSPGLLETTDAVRTQNTIAHLAEAVASEDGELTEHFFKDILILQQCKSAICADETVSACIRFFEEAFSEPVSLDELAVRFSVSKQGLIRKFKRFTGRTPMEHLTHIRISHARRLLRDTLHSVSEIALCCGYENVYYFSNVFKQQTGMRPTDYRKFHRL